MFWPCHGIYTHRTEGNQKMTDVSPSEDDEHGCITNIWVVKKNWGANDRYTSMHLYVCICAGRDQRAMLDKSLTPRGTHADVQRLIGQPSTCSVAAAKMDSCDMCHQGKPKKTRSPARRFPISSVNLFTFHLCKLLKFYQILGFLLGEPVIFHTNGGMDINIGVL